PLPDAHYETIRPDAGDGSLLNPIDREQAPPPLRQRDGEYAAMEVVGEDAEYFGARCIDEALQLQAIAGHRELRIGGDVVPDAVARARDGHPSETGTQHPQPHPPAIALLGSFCFFRHRLFLAHRSLTVPARSRPLSAALESSRPPARHSLLPTSTP